MAMKLMTKKIEKVLAKYPLYSQEGMEEKATVVVKYFTPDSSYTWYVTEGSRTADGDWTLFGLVFNGREFEWGLLQPQGAGSPAWAVGSARGERPLSRPHASQGCFAQRRTLLHTLVIPNPIQ